MASVFTPAGGVHAGDDQRLAKGLHAHRLVVGLQLPKQADVLRVVDGEFGFVSLPAVALLIEAAGWPLRSLVLTGPRRRVAQKRYTLDEQHKRKQLHAGNTTNKETRCQSDRP